MKRALCFVVLINKEAKTVLDWLLSDKFIRGFLTYAEWEEPFDGTNPKAVLK